jgi:hypothetical protein
MVDVEELGCSNGLDCFRRLRPWFEGSQTLSALASQEFCGRSIQVGHLEVWTSGQTPPPKAVLAHAIRQYLFQDG